MEKNSGLNDLSALYQEMLFESTIPFWLKNAQDPQFGGISTCLDRKGEIYSPDKSIWMQGRTAYTFAKLCTVYGNRDEWLKLARSCLDFLNEHAIDKSDERLYFTVTREGAPLRKRRYFFSETFYIIGHAQYYLASGDEKMLQLARKYYDFVCQMYDDPACDPFKIWPKTMPETRDTRSLGKSMILLNVTQVMREADREREELYRKRGAGFAADIIKYHYKREFNCVLETVDISGQALMSLPEGRVINAGHAIECSWFMADEAKYQKDEKLLQQAISIYQGALEWGWDDTYGGILYFVDALGKPPVAYEHDMKLWWPLCEALIASLKYYMVTGQSRYWSDFTRFSEYGKTFFWDEQYGEWYGYLRRDGKPTEPAVKGGIYKGPFHLPRALILVDQMLTTLKNQV